MQSSPIYPVRSKIIIQRWWNSQMSKMPHHTPPFHASIHTLFSKKNGNQKKFRYYRLIWNISLSVCLSVYLLWCETHFPCACPTNVFIFDTYCLLWHPRKRGDRNETFETKWKDIAVLENYQALLWWIGLFHIFSQSFELNCCETVIFIHFSLHGCPLRLGPYLGGEGMYQKSKNMSFQMTPL